MGYQKYNLEELFKGTISTIINKSPINFDYNILKQVDINKFPENVEFRPIFEWNGNKPIIHSERDFTFIKKDNGSNDIDIYLNYEENIAQWNNPLVSLELYIDTLYEVIKESDIFGIFDYEDDTKNYRCIAKTTLKNVTSMSEFLEIVTYEVEELNTEIVKRALHKAKINYN